MDYLGELDPDSSRPASEQIATILRAAIQSGRLAAGERLPSQTDLASHYQVARETVKSAQRALENERLIVRRQGSGVSVRIRPERAVALRPQIEAAFDQPNVTIDFAGFSGETLKNALVEILDKIRAGLLTPQTVHIRMLLMDTQSESLAVPRRVGTSVADPAVRQRSERITRRSIDPLLEEIEEIADRGVIDSITAEARVHEFTAWFKMYILNQEEMFFGLYPITEHAVKLDEEKKTPIYDLMGKDSSLFFHSANDDEDSSDSPRFIQEAQNWFDSLWSTLAHPYQR